MNKEPELYFGWDVESNSGFFAEVPLVLVRNQTNYPDKEWLERVCLRYNGYEALKLKVEELEKEIEYRDKEKLNPDGTCAHQNITSQGPFRASYCRDCGEEL